MVGKRICPPVFHSIEPQAQIRTERQEARRIQVGHKMRCCWVVPYDAGRNHRELVVTTSDACLHSWPNILTQAEPRESQVVLLERSSAGKKVWLTEAVNIEAIAVMWDNCSHDSSEGQFSFRLLFQT